MYQDQDRTTPYGSPAGGRVFLHQFKHGASPGRLVVVTLVLGLLGIALGAASLVLLLMYRTTATAQASQISQMRQELSQEQSSLSKAQSGNSASYSALNGKISAIGSVLAPYEQVCETDLTNASGQPAAFWFPCSSARP